MIPIFYQPHLLFGQFGAVVTSSYLRGTFENPSNLGYGDCCFGMLAGTFL